MNRRRSTPETDHPLVTAAQQFTACLDPPSLPAEKRTPGTIAKPVLRGRKAPAVRPSGLSLKFVLHGTSCYPEQPGRSMALVSESGGSEADGRWVKEGDQLGHFVVHEIRRSIVVCRDGDRLCEISVERKRLRRNLVRSTSGGTRKVSAATEQDEVMLRRPDGPNNEQATGKE